MPDINSQYQFLDQTGLQKLIKGILGVVNTRISERITLTVNSNSDEMHVPSAAAVYRAIVNSKHLKTKTITGNINEQVPLAQRSADTIYWQRDDQNDTKWQIYVWVDDDPANGDLNGTWINLGDTEVNLDNYWSKSEADVASMRYVLGINDLVNSVATKASQDSLDAVAADLADLEDTVTTLSATVDTKASQDDLDALQIAVDALPTFDDLADKVNEADLDAIPLTTIQTILDGAYAETNLFAPKHNLTVNFLYPDGRTPIATPYTAEVPELNTYTVVPPTIDGGEVYYPTVSTVTGTMGTADIVRNVTYEIVDDIDNPQHLLSIAYEGPEGFTAPATHLELVAEEAEYSVASPEVVGFTPDQAVVAGTMGNDNVIVTVTYTADAGSQEDEFNDDEPGSGAGEGSTEGGGAELG